MTDIVKQNVIDKLIKGLIILVAGVALGYLALVLVYLLPTDVMEQNVRESKEMFAAEEISPLLIDGYDTTRLDNYSDGLILNSAIYNGKESVFEKAAAIFQYRYGNEDYYHSLLKYLDEVEGLGVASYERDWHGYLVYVKPLLLFMNYADIRLLNMTMQILIVGILIYSMYQFGISKYIPAFIMSLIFLTWGILYYSIEYSAMFYVFMIASVLAIRKNGSLIKRQHIPEFFLIIGMIVSYIDVLTYPILTIGIPLTYLFILNEEWSESIGRIIAHIATASFWWIFGYGGMWTGKWIIASFVLKSNVIKEAVLMALYRMSQTSGESGALVEFTSAEVFAKNFGVFIKPAYVIAVLAFLIWLIVRMSTNGTVFSTKRIVPNIIIAMMPVVWYLALGNHSYIHYWMTHRDIALIVFAICSMGINMINTKKEPG